MKVFIHYVLVAILTLHLCFCEAVLERYTTRNACPLQVLNYMSRGHGCNTALGTLKNYINNLNSYGIQGGTSDCTCIVYFSYDTQHYYWKMYDISQTIITFANKRKSFDAGCQNNGNTITTLHINCSLEDYNHYFFENWCRKNSDCFEDQTCNIYGNVGVCSCQNGFFLSRGKCWKGNLPLDAECDNNAQCSGVPSNVRTCSVQDASNTPVKTCSCGDGFTKIQNSCVQGNASAEICIPGTQCQNSNKTCYWKYGDILGVCICRKEFIGIGNRCLIGNLTLGQKCERNEQCSAVTNSLCLSENCACRDGYIPYNKFECIPETVFVGGSCKLDEQCSGSSDSGLCNQFRCGCKEGYISYNQNCYPDNSTLNQNCEIHKQCSTVLNSLCDNGTCVCRDGYTAVYSTHCQQVENKEVIQRDSLLQNSGGNGLGMTLGGIFGGFLLGVLLTVFAVYVLYRRYASDLRKREEPGVAFVGNNTYGSNSAVKVIQGQTLENKGKNVQRKVVNVPPFAPSVETPTYSNVQKAGKSRLKNDYVYNHLNEKEETPENNDHYDVAQGTSRLAETESDYSHLNSGRRNDRVILSQDDEYACTEESNTDNYFTLEKQ